MSRFFATAVFAGVPFGVVMGVLIALQTDINLGLVAVPFTGLGFGLLLAGFTAWQRHRFTREGTGPDGEQLLKQGAANLFRGLEGVGGWLYLTDKRLLFRPHQLNVQKQELSIPLDEVAEVRVCRTAWVVPNGLRVTTNQWAHHFVVEDRRSWVDEISHAKGHPG